VKYTRVTALAAVSVAATLSLTACGGDDAGQKTSSKGAPSSSSASGSSSGGPGSGKAESKSGQDTQARAGAESGAAKSGGKAAFCKTADLTVTAEDAAPDADSGRINVTMVNRGSSTCSATGFPGLSIKDADNTSNPIGRAQAQPRVTTLKPGNAAVFNLAYDIDPSGDSHAHPTHLLVTPPNETNTATVKWPADAGDIKGAYTDVEVYPTHTAK
jgi:hypothetical protein